VPLRRSVPLQRSLPPKRIVPVSKKRYRQRRGPNRSPDYLWSEFGRLAASPPSAGFLPSTWGTPLCAGTSYRFDPTRGGLRPSVSPAGYRATGELLCAWVPLSRFWSLGRFLLPGGRPRRFFVISDNQAGGRPRLRGCVLASLSRVRMASSICVRSWRNSARICVISIAKTSPNDMIKQTTRTPFSGLAGRVCREAPSHRVMALADIRPDAPVSKPFACLRALVSHFAIICTHHLSAGRTRDAVLGVDTRRAWDKVRLRWYKRMDSYLSAISNPWSSAEHETPIRRPQQR